MYISFTKEEIFFLILFILQQVINSKTLNVIRTLNLSKAKAPVPRAAISCRAPNRRLASGVIQCRTYTKCRDKDQ